MNKIEKQRMELVKAMHLAGLALYQMERQTMTSSILLKATNNTTMYALTLCELLKDMAILVCISGMTFVPLVCVKHTKLTAKE